MPHLLRCGVMAETRRHRIANRIVSLSMMAGQCPGPGATSASDERPSTGAYAGGATDSCFAARMNTKQRVAIPP
jgi:hypothetical protein